ncbi:MAG TPA: hypothetical protein VEZ90_07835 [Blastocatellia bacterium]|nr:hypothetical protein [Blastocatellia bacterium]
MLEIKLRQPREGVCQGCEGTGIVIPKDGVMPIQVGYFCSECDEGSRRWEATIQLSAAADGLVQPSKR